MPLSLAKKIYTQIRSRGTVSGVLYPAEGNRSAAKLTSFWGDRRQTGTWRVSSRRGACEHCPDSAPPGPPACIARTHCRSKGSAENLSPTPSSSFFRVSAGLLSSPQRHPAHGPSVSSQRPDGSSTGQEHTSSHLELGKAAALCQVCRRQ